MTQQPEEFTSLVPRWIEQEIHHAFLHSLLQMQLTLTTIERDLQVLGSELCPDLHELNAQLDQFRQRVQHRALNPEREEDGNPPQDDESPSREA